jgi:hypothetical protein
VSIAPPRWRFGSRSGELCYLDIHPYGMFVLADAA